MKLPAYSLSTLFIIMVCAGLGAGLWSSNLRLAEVREENARLYGEVYQLRREMGHLEIGEATDKIHAIALAPALEALTWRWRVYIPPGADVTVHWGFDEIGNEGLHAAFTKDGKFPLEEGEQVLTCAIRKDPRDDGWMLMCQTSEPKGTNGVSLPRDCTPWFTELRSGAFDTPGWLTDQVEGPPTDPLVLLRQRMVQFDEDSHQVRLEPPEVKRDGILIWIGPRSSN